MGFDVLSKLTQASLAAEDFVKKKWEEHKSREAEKEAKQAAAEEARRRDERNRFFDLITAKRTGSSVAEMPPLVCNPEESHKAVFLVTTPISFGKFELSKSTYKLLARHVGMSVDSVSHWLVAVIDRGFGSCFYYELMSDQMALNAIGKNYFRTEEITPGFIETWSSCYYVGETTKSHSEIQELGTHHMTLNPRYNLLSNNCQDMVDSLVKQLCDGRVISQAKLSEELSLASPRIAVDLMVAKLRSKMDIIGEHDDVDKVKDDHKDVEDDVDTIKVLWNRIHRKS
ncbi:hypothetical protein JX265_001923 [Neoarthrinium moseri]|uniref:PPPDE domain-containing protein n=1 Tax=Neoarthrinium moseri TaxID=1658444 RepID=A0A9P9WW44_9PEZI|nr:uncharacterized protein JN550_005672 [Neoarthrinium moseri]KAI1847916.1 hypothetical protein JX266_006029 [Neoarthrinium moseri]KAI1869691.1 hypothetical protein JN550_005672 [Neoarthrinium moseri]KAI1880302.1 hypothetical protein JX265_001923 [Neoarthrinium moseri]